jgi:hypothetical protein
MTLFDFVSQVFMIRQFWPFSSAWILLLVEDGERYA